MRVLGQQIEGADDPTLVAETAAAPEVRDVPMAASAAKGEGEAEVPVAVAESEHRETPPNTHNLPELVVEGPERHLVIRDLVAEAQAQLRGVSGGTARGRDSGYIEKYQSILSLFD